MLIPATIVPVVPKPTVDSTVITDEFLESQIGLNPVVNNVALFDVFSLRNAASATQLWGSYISNNNSGISLATTANTPTNFSDTAAEYDGSQSNANNGVLTFGTGVAASSGWFVDQLHMSSQQPTVDPYANSGQPTAYQNPPNNSPSLGYSFDVSLSGNLFKGIGSSPGISWITTTGNPNINDNSTTVSIKDYNIINSLDGAVTTTTHHSLDSGGGSGAKAWKKHLKEHGVTHSDLHQQSVRIQSDNLTLDIILSYKDFFNKLELIKLALKDYEYKYELIW